MSRSSEGPSQLSDVLVFARGGLLHVRAATAELPRPESNLPSLLPLPPPSSLPLPHPSHPSSSPHPSLTPPSSLPSSLLPSPPFPSLPLQPPPRLIVEERGKGDRGGGRGLEKDQRPAELLVQAHQCARVVGHGCGLSKTASQCCWPSSDGESGLFLSSLGQPLLWKPFNVDSIDERLVTLGKTFMSFGSGLDHSTRF